MTSGLRFRQVLSCFGALEAEFHWRSKDVIVSHVIKMRLWRDDGTHAVDLAWLRMQFMPDSWQDSKRKSVLFPDGYGFE